MLRARERRSTDDTTATSWDGRAVRPSLYAVAGGEPAFLALAAAHHARCLADPELNHPFSHPGQHPQHVERLAAYWAEVLGGPPRYSQECGDHSAVLQMHAGNGDMVDLGARFVACFVAAADDAGLPADPEFRDALRAYMEWAVAEVLTYSPVDASVAPGLAMPRWSWDGLEAAESSRGRPDLRREHRRTDADPLGDARDDPTPGSTRAARRRAT
jgi:hemoglobin